MPHKFSEIFSRLVVLGLFVMSGSAEALAGEPVTVKIVQDSAYPPYMTTGLHGPAGVYADIIREAGSRLPQFNIDLQAAPWPRAKYLVSSGKAHALLGTYFRPRERPWIGQFSRPLVVEEVHLYCRKGISQDSWRFPEDYAGLLFSNNSGFATPGKTFFDLVDAGRIEVVEEQTTKENLRLVQLGRADCFVQEKAAVETLLRTGRFDQIQDVGPIRREPAHIGYNVKWTENSMGQTFAEEMDAVLQNMEADGSIASIIARHIQDPVVLCSATADNIAAPDGCPE